MPKIGVYAAKDAQRFIEERRAKDTEKEGKRWQREAKKHGHFTTPTPAQRARDMEANNQLARDGQGDLIFIDTIGDR